MDYQLGWQTKIIIPHLHMRNMRHNKRNRIDLEHCTTKCDLEIDDNNYLCRRRHLNSYLASRVWFDNIFIEIRTVLRFLLNKIRNQWQFKHALEVCYLCACPGAEGTSILSSLRFCCPLHGSSASRSMLPTGLPKILM